MAGKHDMLCRNRSVILWPFTAMAGVCSKIVRDKEMASKNFKG